MPNKVFILDPFVLCHIIKMNMIKTIKSAKTQLGNEIFLLGNEKPAPKEVRPLVIGVFHGDEPQGKFLIEEYLKKFSNETLYPPLDEQTELARNEPCEPVIQSEAKCRVSKSVFSTLPQGEGMLSCSFPYPEKTIRNLLFLPCLNPDGMELGTRTNANGVDLNRNFPTENWEFTARDEFFGGERPASEIETRFVMEIIEEYKPSLILTLHAPFKVVNYDGDAKEISEKISKIINYPVEESIGYPTPGSFGTYAGIEKKIPTITLELDETCPVEELISPVHKIFDIL